MLLEDLEPKELLSCKMVSPSTYLEEKEAFLSKQIYSPQNFLHSH